MENNKENQISLVQPNKVTSARYNYSAREENILTLIVAAVQGHMTREQTIQRDLFGLPQITIDIKDVGCKHKSEYLNALEKLRIKSISFEWKNPVDGKTRETHTSLVSAYHNVKQTSIIEVALSTWSIPYLLYWGNGVGGTIFNKITALTLSSQYTKRIYKNCKRWEDKGGFSLSIKEFREMLCLDNFYSKNANLKARILEPAKKELSKNADIYFDYTFEKIGGSRSYNQLNFSIKSNNKKLDNDNKTELYLLVYNIIGLAYPSIKSSKAKDITDKLADNPYILEKAYKRLIKIKNELDDGSKSYEDTIKLIKFILNEDYSE